jgi:hypothetical protein
MGSISYGSHGISKILYGSAAVGKVFYNNILVYSASAKLATPQNVSVSGTDASFDEVAHAQTYELFVDGNSIGTYSAVSYRQDGEVLTIFSAPYTQSGETLTL